MHDTEPASGSRIVRAQPFGAQSPELRFELTTPADLDELGRSWSDIESRGAPSFFQSWSWMGTWLRLLPPDLRPMVLIAYSGTTPVAIGTLFRSVQRRHGLIGSNSLHLNESGNPLYDCLTIEYNGFLADQAYAEADATGRAMQYLLARGADWDEFYFGGVTFAYVDGVPALKVSQSIAKPVHYTDLSKVRQAGGDLLAVLSANSRQQIRRASKLYSSRGGLRATCATSLGEAQSFFDGLKDLHQKYWISRGRPGSFANPFFERFHRVLIETRFGAGEIQLLRICAGEAPIGYLYNFVHRGRVYAYQSGFSYETDNKLKPGLVSHALAIEHNLRAGHLIYDFMAGDGQHKRTLSTDATTLWWVCLQKPRLKFMIEDLLRRAKHTFSGRAGDS